MQFVLVIYLGFHPLPGTPEDIYSQVSAESTRAALTELGGLFAEDES